MAKYKDLVGTGVVNFAGDNPAVVRGQLWYDSTNKDFKYQYPSLTATGSWRTGVAVNSGRGQMRSAGTYTAALTWGGEPGFSALTENWNGSNWTEVNNLNTGRSQAAGIGAANTACIAAGGYGVPGAPYYVTNVESWNGTNWTEVNDLNTARGLAGMSGNAPSTAGLIFAGDGTGPNSTANTEIWNGTNWTEVNDLNEAKYAPWGSGNASTAAICYGGNLP